MKRLYLVIYGTLSTVSILLFFYIVITVWLSQIIVSLSQIIQKDLAELIRDDYMLSIGFSIFLSIFFSLYFWFFTLKLIKDKDFHLKMKYTLKYTTYSIIFFVVLLLIAFLIWSLISTSWEYMMLLMLIWISGIWVIALLQIIWIYFDLGENFVDKWLNSSPSTFPEDFVDIGPQKLPDIEPSSIKKNSTDQISPWVTRNILKSKWVIWAVIVTSMNGIYIAYSVLFFRWSMMGPLSDFSCRWNCWSYYSQWMSPEKYCHMPRYLSFEAQTKSGTVFSDDHWMIHIPRGTKVLIELPIRPKNTGFRFGSQVWAGFAPDIKSFSIDWWDWQNSGPCNSRAINKYTDECGDFSHPRWHIYSIPWRYKVSARYSLWQMDWGSWHYEWIVGVY